MRTVASAPFALRPSTGQSGTSARQATASEPARIAFARSSFGGAFEVIPVLPPWLWTSTEIDWRSTASAAEAVSAVSRRFGRTGRPGLAGKHRPDRCETCSPEREVGLRGVNVAVAAAIHFRPPRPVGGCLNQI